MKIITAVLSTLVLAFSTQSVWAHGVFTGPWSFGGHYVGAPVLFKFVDSPDPVGTNPHPARAWTEAEKKVLRQSFSEWDTVLCDICFQEISTDPILGTITLRWEDSDLFGGALSSAFIAWSYVYNAPFDFNLGADYPVGEIYFNTAKSWYVDPDPTTDEAFGASLWDLLTVATHEIGHMIGLQHQYQDYFDAHPTYVPGIMDDRPNPAGWFEGERRHVTNADWEALRQLGYAVHVSEPPAVALFVLALALLAMRRRSPLSK